MHGWMHAKVVCCRFQDPPVEAAPAESGVVQTFHHSVLRTVPKCRKHVVKLQKMSPNYFLESGSLISDH